MPLILLNMEASRIIETPHIDTGERIRQIYFELQGVCKITTALGERLQILNEYNNELERISGVMNASEGTETSAILFVRKTASDAIEQTKRMIKHQRAEELKASSLKSGVKTKQFAGSAEAFKDYFTATDREIYGIFAGTFHPAPNNRLKWLGCYSDAIRFSKGIGQNGLRYLNECFCNDKGRKFAPSDLNTRKPKPGGGQRKLPKIYELIKKYRALPDSILSEYKKT